MATQENYCYIEKLSYEIMWELLQKRASVMSVEELKRRQRRHTPIAIVDMNVDSPNAYARCPIVSHVNGTFVEQRPSGLYLLEGAQISHLRLNCVMPFSERDSFLLTKDFRDLRDKGLLAMELQTDSTPYSRLALPTDKVIALTLQR